MAYVNVTKVLFFYIKTAACVACFVGLGLFLGFVLNSFIGYIMEALVVDIGSSSVKAGYSGEEKPTTLIPSVISSYQKGMTTIESSGSESYGGEIASKSSHPIHRGQVKNWDHLEKLWGTIFAEEVGARKHMPSIMLVESLKTTLQDRLRWAEMLFETFHAPSICLGNSASLSLFASGRTTGLVAECGAGTTSAVPIFEGLVLAHATTTVEFGGQDISSALQNSLMERGVVLDWNEVRAMKEKYASVKAPTQGHGNEETYELPDGREVATDSSVLWDCSEKLVINSRLVPNGLASQLHEAVKLCDEDIRYTMARNIILAGGTSMIKGLGDRLQHEITQRFSKDANTMGAEVRVVPSSGYSEAGYTTQRRHAAWIGGSILASLDTFKHLRITRSEWEEGAESILQTKCI